MEQLAVVAFLIVHGFVHAAVWTAPKPANQPTPFDPAHSWALAAAHIAASASRTASLTLAWLGAGLFAAAGCALALDTTAWTSLAVLAATVGLVLKGLWFNRWLSLGVVLDLGVIAAVASSWPNV
jgi:hypothetical protein